MRAGPPIPSAFTRIYRGYSKIQFGVKGVGFVEMERLLDNSAFKGIQRLSPPRESPSKRIERFLDNSQGLRAGPPIPSAFEGMDGLLRVVHLGRSTRHATSGRADKPARIRDG